VVLVFRDQTKEQKMIEYIQRTAKLDSLGILAGGIAHDFNNLLGGVFGYVEMAKVSTEDPQAVSDYLSEAMKAFDRAKDLTLQLLTFSKGGVPSLQHGSLESVIRKSVSLTLSGSRSSCIFDIPEDLWPCRFDQNQIGQVVDNLIINAQQAMPNGGKITIKAANTNLADNQVPGLPEGSYIRISISDTGEGIPAALMEKVFDPFFSTKPQGSGLGLATSYSIIKKHQGIIDISSRVGQGSVVTFYLPKAADDTSNIIVDESTAEHAGEGIFVVMDDESIIRDIAGAMLTSMGYKVREAACGEDLLAICRELNETGEPVAGAILDLTIPGGMGGRETVLKCRKEYPELPIFASSGYSEDPIMAYPSKFGFTASLSKPYTRDDLAALLEQFIKPGREQAPQQS
jgi:two-component system, cell cycle sensor histidine kinase and response regulator CckA